MPEPAAAPPNPTNRLRAVLDVTPLLGLPTGIHQSTAALLKALQNHQDIAVSGYVISARATTRQLQNLGVRFGIQITRSRIPATICHRSWRHTDLPHIQRIIRHADIIHGTNFTAPPPNTTPTHAQTHQHTNTHTAPARLITVQDFGLITHPEWCTPTIRRMGLTLRRAVTRGAHIHVTTQNAIAESITVLGADPSQVHCVPLGVHPIGQGNAESAHRLVTAERYVLTLGATEPRKDLTFLPGIIAKLDNDVKLVVAGPRGSDENAITQAVRKHNLNNRYLRITKVNTQQRADLIYGATALAYPSLMEGFGLPPLEATVAGTPVVATAVGALPELLSPDIPLITPGNHHEFADYLSSVIATPPPQSPAAQDRIAKLTWNRAAKRLTTIYHTITTK